jgi:hypothetical protein
VKKYSDIKLTRYGLYICGASIKRRLIHLKEEETAVGAWWERHLWRVGNCRKHSALKRCKQWPHMLLVVVSWTECKSAGSGWFCGYATEEKKLSRICSALGQNFGVRKMQCSLEFGYHVFLCISTRWFKYDRDKLWLVYTQIVLVIFEPPCTGKPWWCLLGWILQIHTNF